MCSQSLPASFILMHTVWCLKILISNRLFSHYKYLLIFNMKHSFCWKKRTRKNWKSFPFRSSKHNMNYNRSFFHFMNFSHSWSTHTHTHTNKTPYYYPAHCCSIPVEYKFPQLEWVAEYTHPPTHTHTEIWQIWQILSVFPITAKPW